MANNLHKGKGEDQNNYLLIYPFPILNPFNYLNDNI